MIKDCLEIFKKELSEHGDRLILDEYIPADGTYLIVNLDDNHMKRVNIKQDKKTKEIDKSVEYFKEICAYDYNSKLIDMNKPIDNKKIIHSNNYLSFFIKKDSLNNGKLTEEVIDNYYNILSNPLLKYTKPNAKELYKAIEKEVGVVDCELLEKCKKWIKENIFNLRNEITGKDYIKIFFEFPIEAYEKEGKRYLVPNIYNSTDFNISVGDKVLGLPNDNMGLNAKKPYLENKTRKTKVPYLVDSEEVILQKKFFDYLMNFATKGKVNIYIDDEFHGIGNSNNLEEDFSGRFLRIKKGKEVEIHDYDIITDYKTKLPKIFVFKNILDINQEKSTDVKYGEFETLKSLKDILNEVLFSKWLVGNYFTDASDMSINDGVLKNSILISRERLFNWFYKGNSYGISSLLEKISINLVKNSLNNGYIQKASHQFNLRWSLINYFKGGIDMADVIYDIKESLKLKINEEKTSKIENDNEYYFAVGQLVSYLLSKNKGKKKPQSLVNPFINAKSNEIIKEKLRALYKKYNYDIEASGRRMKNLYAMILSYEIENKVNQDIIIAGYLHSNLIYEKVEDK